MKKMWTLLIAGSIFSACGQPETPGEQEEGKPLYITDSLASQLNTPLPDSNTKEHKDSLEKSK